MPWRRRWSRRSGEALVKCVCSCFGGAGKREGLLLAGRSWRQLLPVHVAVFYWQRRSDREHLLKDVPVHLAWPIPPWAPKSLVPDVPHGYAHSCTSPRRLLASLQNPYLVQYHEAFVDHDRLCIVTELMPGGDLSTALCVVCVLGGKGGGDARFSRRLAGRLTTARRRRLPAPCPQDVTWPALVFLHGCDSLHAPDITRPASTFPNARALAHTVTHTDTLTHTH